MPVYEYKCTECGTEFVKLIQNEDETVSCTRCFGGAVTKLSPQQNSRHKAGAGNCPCNACQTVKQG